MASGRRATLVLATVWFSLFPGLARTYELPAAGTFSSGASFTRVTEGEIVTIPAFFWNGCWGDFDDDGWLDLFVGATLQSPRNFLYHNDRDGTFTRVDDAAMPKSPSNQHGCAWGDYDNDGHVDLIVTSGNPGLTHNTLYHNDGNGTFSWATDNPVYTETSDHGFHAPSWGDYDNDGLVDLFITGHEIHNRLFHNDGDGAFTSITSHPFVDDFSPSDRGTEARAFVDYDDDGDLDLFVSRMYVPSFFDFTNVVYRNDGAGVFTSVIDSGLSGRVADRNAFASCWADYDNDGLQDLFIANAQKNSLYHNDGGGKFRLVAGSTVVKETIPPSAIFGGCAWGDYDNDGFVDLLTGAADHIFGGGLPRRTTFLYRNAGDGTFTKVTEGDLGTGDIGGQPSWVDYDNDGFLDLFLVPIGQFEPRVRASFLFHNDGNANAWLNVKLEGTVSNASAIGAKVRVHAFYRGESRWQLREISGGDNQDNQQSLNAEFGLADAMTIDTVRVEWPSGIVQELHDVAPRQFLTITETLPIQIDVEPGNGRKPIQPQSRGLVRVALLGSDPFDVREIDVATLAFGPDEAKPTQGQGVEDVNEDGFADLVTRFRARDTGLEEGDGEACLKGNLAAGTPFAGCGAIRTVPARR